ncbi:type II toxin-antitoxin system VapC family toxin [Aurantimonas sp. Leaf443]|uniref:type II toxin-antitoxin system VapC family toxin n=1 Tax=Aurantimonas sp. Leaf443 TaxID=1736378 RepID=UPI0007001685|nr:type II toxin-antitoxin system VapC family toxin [Aurantimonas sp. Leaf443]KQT83902.1 hypothetical protein ASG48_10935 [Aurantimonas sp. Leaf443]
MIVVDTSAIVAILQGEPEARAIAECADRQPAVMSAGTAVELSIVVLSRWGEDGLLRIRAISSELALEIVPVDALQVDLATDAYRRYGRGSGSPARLNFGDCFSYALARALDRPLLFKGDDFPHTDVTSALGSS